jgi:tetratricopeptide (TPR) repeat protein
MNGIWLEVVVEDPSGKHGAILRLMHFTPPKYSQCVTPVDLLQQKDGYLLYDFRFPYLPCGSFIAVKNCYSSAIHRNEFPHVFLIQCNNPADVVVLSPKKVEEMYPGLYLLCICCILIEFGLILLVYFTEIVWNGSPLNPGMTFDFESVKKIGNEAFISNRYVDALRWYDMALDYTENPEDKANIWSNKAASFLGLQLGCSQRALECCDEALSLNPGHLKSFYRRTKALLALGRYTEASSFFKEKMCAYPELDENVDFRKLR